MSITYEPIGTIHSPFTRIEDMPIQPAGALGVRGTVEVFAEFAQGLQDLDGFSHLVLLYHFHRVRQARLVVVPFLDKEEHGVFATRAPTRPNPIGISVVELLRVEGPVLHIQNVDVLDGTPLLDIKPYVPQFDHFEVQRTGWLEAARGSATEAKSDHRFG
ncbi:MAG: tRNA (N6-threonylcarbamoyladenosine(37)-N6)-methyltransferase TrmO [Anaerolineae bacterium]|nr:tRNA (N6-threonylcarbamoyladenosine(37)-N6)-methyltransferase TrmO [Anaerolineae bacterium]